MLSHCWVSACFLSFQASADAMMDVKEKEKKGMKKSADGWMMKRVTSPLSDQRNSHNVPIADKGPLSSDVDPYCNPLAHRVHPVHLHPHHRFPCSAKCQRSENEHLIKPLWRTENQNLSLFWRNAKEETQRKHRKKSHESNFSMYFKKERKKRKNTHSTENYILKASKKLFKASNFVPTRRIHRKRMWIMWKQQREK